MLTPQASLAIILAIIPAQALGQPEPAEQPQSDPIEQQIEDAERLVPRPPGEVEAFSPKHEASTSPVRPGLTGGEDWATMLEPTWPGAAGPALLPERSFVNNLRGTVVRGPHDTRIFVPASTPASGSTRAERKTPPPRAMLLLPCTILDRFNTYVLADQPSTSALLSGQVFLYNDRNYILPTTFRRATGTPPPSAPTADPDDEGEDEADISRAGGTEPATDSSVDALADNPDVSALMSQLERHSPIARPAARKRALASGTEKSAESTPVSDGQYITARRGRVIRTPEGTWSFVPDSDETPSTRAINITLLPCRTLEALEHLALRQGDAAAGLMSGRLYQSQGHTYLLPTLYQVEHRGGVDPLQ